jgi:hypothetical protein
MGFAAKGDRAWSGPVVLEWMAEGEIDATKIVPL